MFHSPLVIAVFGLVFAKFNGLLANTESSLTSTQRSDIVYPKLWISNLFYKALVNFTVRDGRSTACQNQVKMYEQHLWNYTNWAVQSKNQDKNYNL